MTYYEANGWIPHVQGSAASGRQDLRNWLGRQIDGGEFNRHQVHHHNGALCRWSHQSRYLPRIQGAHPQIHHVEQRLYHFPSIPIQRTQHHSAGWVSERICTDTPLCDPEEMIGVPMDYTQVVRDYCATSPQETNYRVYDVIRILPETQPQLRQWGVARTNERADSVILAEWRLYNAQVLQRLVVRRQSTGYAHAETVRTRSAQCEQWIYQCAFSLATSVGSSSAMNFAPGIGDIAAGSYDSMSEAILAL